MSLFASPGLAESLLGRASNYCVLMMRLFRVLMLQLRRTAAKHAISGPPYTKLPGVGSQIAGIYVEGEVWREHFMSIGSGDVQMVHEGVASSV